ncbi:MAG TPA: beta-galactosidase [Thermomicrobiales bacterium]|nr:beta-galactosidase [Thermomicrobiales bacterium]
MAASSLPTTFSLGVCYYPEQWPEDRWDLYATRMRELGLAWARIGEFAWSRIEPAPEQYTWDWLDRAIESLANQDLGVVLGTPTGAPPPWLIEQHPDILPVDPEGRTRNLGSRKHYDHASPVYREHARRIAQAMAERYGQHEAVIGWQIDNEWGESDSTRSYGPVSAAAFRAWLRNRYGSLERLNEAWGGVFWSQEYSDWDQIDPPNLTMNDPNPSHTLDFYRFSSDAIVDFQNLQVEVIRAASPGRFITHNGMGHFGEVDYYKCAEMLDFMSWDSYPTGQVDKDLLPDFDPDYWARTGHPDLTGLNHDLIRGLKQGPGPIVMEQQAGQINWAKTNPLPPDGAVALWTVQAWAHGCGAVSYFRWRAAVGGQEIMHSGLLRYDESWDRGGVEVANLQITGAPLDPIPARVVLLHDYESLWISDLQPHAEGWSYWKQFTLFYSTLRRLGADVDIRHVDSNLDGYDVIVAPAIQIVDQRRADHLVSAARNASLVVGPRTGFRQPTGQVHPDGQPGPLRDLLGCSLLNFDALRPKMSVTVDDEEVTLWAESYRTERAEVMFRYDNGPLKGQAAVVRNGRAFTIGAFSPILIGRVFAHVLTEAGLDVTPLDDGVRVARRGDRTVWLNFAEDDHRLPDGRTIDPVSFLID